MLAAMKSCFGLIRPRSHIFHRIFWSKRPSVATFDALVRILWLQLTTIIIIHFVIKATSHNCTILVSLYMFLCGNPWAILVVSNAILTRLNRAIFNRVSKVYPGLHWFCFTSLCDWSRKLAPSSQPIRCKTKTNRDLVTRVFPRLTPFTCICFELWLAPWNISLCFDWRLWLLWFWFYDTLSMAANLVAHFFIIFFWW